MNCKKTTRLIGRYIDGELSPSLVDKLEAHLSTCSLCRLQYEKFKRLSELIAQWEPTRPALGYEALRERIRQRERLRSISALPVPRWVAATLSLISIGIGLTAGIRSERPVRPHTASVNQVASIIGLSQHDDLVEAAILTGFRNVTSEKSGAKR